MASTENSGPQISVPLRSMADHLFLPRKISGLTSEETELALAQQFADFVQDQPEYINVSRVLQQLVDYRTLPPERDELNRLLSVPDALVAVPLLNHNAVLVFRNLPKAQMISVSALDILPNQTAIQSLVPGDPYPDHCRLAVPRLSLATVPNQVLSESFLDQLVQLGTQQKGAYAERDQSNSGRSERRETSERKHPPCPVYVFDWLLATLQQLPALTPHSVVFKSIRMEYVRADRNIQIPWSRSMLWVAVKSTLHVVLITLHGAEEGTRRYKEVIALFTARFLETVAEASVSDSLARFDLGQLREMCGKVARKADKLQQRFPASGATVASLSQTCQRIYDMLQQSWSGHLGTYELRNRIDINDIGFLNFDLDERHSLSKAQNAMRAALETSATLDRMRLQNQPVSLAPGSQLVSLEVATSRGPRARGLDEIASLLARELAQSQVMEETQHSLQVVEEFIRCRLWPTKSHPHSVSPAYCYALFQEYQKVAAREYADPVEQSTMLLYLFALYCIFDARSIALDPLGVVQNHQLTVIPPEQLQKLLIRHRENLELLEQVADYITQRTGENLLPGIFSVCSGSLADEYARRYRTMGECEREYQTELARVTAEKLLELQEAKNRHDRLRQRRDDLTCRCPSSNSGSSPAVQHRCARCEIGEEMRQIEYSVSVTEKRLPECSVLRRVIFFHQKIPSFLLYVRETAALLIEMLVPDYQEWPVMRMKITEWPETSTTYRVFLGSNKKPNLTSRGYRSQFQTNSIFRPVGEFLFQQGKNVRLILSSRRAIFPEEDSLVWVISEYHAFPRSSLDKYALDVSHSENEVICQQALCPRSMQLAAFKDFGTLRAGGYLQWRNIAVTLENSTLDLNDTAVLQLILQAMYQVGPTPAFEHWKADLLDKNFVPVLLKHVNTALDRIEHSWNCSNSLLLCITVAAFVAEHAEGTDALQVLLKCRKIARQWSEAMERELLQETSGLRTIHRRLRFVNCLIVLTYGVFGKWEMEHGLLSSDNDMFDLLRARAVSAEVPKAGELFGSNWHDTLLRLNARIMARLEGLIHDFLEDSSSPLDRLLRDRWNPFNIGLWERCESPLANYWYSQCQAQDGTTSTVHFDVSRGTLFVDGEPTRRLPDRVLNHQLFQRTFRGYHMSVFHRGGGVFETKHAHKGASYTFAVTEDNQLVVREIHGVTSRRLLDSAVFADELPADLFACSHWISTEDGFADIEMRPALILDEKFQDPAYVITPNGDFSGEIRHVESKRKFLNYCGDNFRTLYDSVIGRLERKDHALAFLPNRFKEVPDEGWILCVFLPRLRLHIEVLPYDRNLGASRIRIREFENMHVAEQQSIGTFIGLDNQLVLENAAGRKTVVIPYLQHHAIPEIGHHRLVAENWDLCSEKTPFFAFSEDPAIRQYRPYGTENFSSWLMCVYVHAATSSAMPDPFTGLTGLEMAVVQMRRCYTNRPYDELSLSILRQIEQLGVQRSAMFGSEVLLWSANRSSYASSDVLPLMVSLLLRRSGQEESWRTSHNLQLSGKAYRRYHWIYSTHALLEPTETLTLNCSPQQALLPEIPEEVTVRLQREPVYRLMHSSRCRTAVLRERNIWSRFSWKDFFESFRAIQPAKIIGNHVGQWNAYDFQTSEWWLSLYYRALKLSQTANARAREPFALLLSLAAWKLRNDISRFLPALYQLLLISMSSGLRLPDQLPQSQVLNPQDRFLDARSIRFFDQLSYETQAELETNPHWSRHNFNSYLARRLSVCDAWRVEGAGRVAIRDPAVPDPFRNLFDGCPAILGADEKNGILRLVKHYHEDLFLCQQLHRFCVDLDAIVRNELIDSLRSFTRSCSWTCTNEVTAEVRIFHIPFEPDQRRLRCNRTHNRRLDDEDYVIDAGQDERLESLFESCLVEEASVDADVLENPLAAAAQALLDDPMGREFLDQLHASWSLFQDRVSSSKRLTLASNVRAILEECRSIAEHRAKVSWGVIEGKLEPRESIVSQSYKAAGILDSIVPRTIFPLFGAGNQFPQALFKCLATHLVNTVYAQKAQRCLQMLGVLEKLQGKPSNDYALQIINEILEKHCCGWTPKDYPKWLLFEVENNLLLRKNQVLVIRGIVSGEHQLLQLNMGEGKTSVIAPLVCSTLANGEQLVRLTLLSSLLDTHGQDLAMRLGGLLNQPVFFFYCRRDMPFSEHLVASMEKQLLECLRGCGCVVTAPEFRLSVILKFEEMLISLVNSQETSASSAAKALFRLFQLEKKCIIDILDESDEILRHKYQLLYTIGSQQAVDGHERRWKVVQAVLVLLSSSIGSFFADHLEEFASSRPMIYQSRTSECGSKSWPLVRLISKEIFAPLRETLVNLIVAGRAADLSYMASLDQQSVRNIKRYLVSKESRQTEEDLEIIQALKSNLSTQQWTDVLVLRGLLTYEVLHYSLTRRWSVDYGVNTLTQRRLMAVPFRGKDVPSERTEFGHPDIALLLTHLSYYYSGLNEYQMRQALDKLSQYSTREAEYHSWLDAYSTTQLAERNITRNVGEINIEDGSQVRSLTSFFQYNMATIHFWLNTFVLAKETKQFPYKLVASAWDLAEKQLQPVRGFSGTKDASKLFPLQVSLGSLPELDATDGEVMYRVTSADNRRVLQMSYEVTGQEVIEKMITSGDEGSVLIDAGALMIGMNNLEVAQHWLQRAPPRYLGAAYFDGNTVMIVLRDGHRTQLENSPLKQSLLRVLVYVDDIHTRGTDFKFPVPTHAYVTLGRNLPKDKFVQSCMRMRRLGQGHSVTFLAPAEIYCELRNLCSGDETPDSRIVLQWCVRNTVFQLREGMLQWAQQGLVFSRRQAALSLLSPASALDEVGRIRLYCSFVKVREITKLDDLYEAFQGQAAAVNVVQSLAHRYLKIMETAANNEPTIELGREALQTCRRLVRAMLSDVTERCRVYLSSLEVNVKFLDEEQERELEQELQEERQVHLPTMQKPYEPQQPVGLLELLIGMEPPQQWKDQLRPLWRAMRRTTIFSLANTEDFDKRFSATRNYRHTLAVLQETEDEYIRPPRWILVIWDQQQAIKEAILLCPSEANIAMRLLRTAESTRASLHRFAPRTRRDQDELLTSVGLAQWARHDVPSSANAEEELRSIASVLTIFGCSPCLENDQAANDRSVMDICKYLRIVPAPSVPGIGVAPEDWQKLREANLIDGDGFLSVAHRQSLLPQAARANLSRSCVQLLREVSTGPSWSRSLVHAAVALVSIRNMEPWFPRSDLNHILFCVRGRN